MGAILHWLGADNASGTPYLLWSGFIGNVTIIFSILAAPIVLYRKHDCDIRRCWRLARQDYKDPEHDVHYHLCRKHHPDIPRKPLTAAQLQHRFHLYLGDKPGKG